MKFRACGILLALAATATLVVPASAQRKPSIAVMPAGYFAADAESAAALTRGLTEQYERQGYSVVQGRGDVAQQTHHPDRTALEFGRAAGADLVAYPRLLAVGIPAANNETAGTIMEPNAVVHLRVLNVHTGQVIYFRQIAHEFRSDRPTDVAAFSIPQPIATAAATEASGMYFERVAGSRQETRTR